MDAGVSALPPPVRAFDAVAETFDGRFGAWRSVAAQRDAVRRLLLRSFAPGSHLLELGGGTGEDALHLARQGYRVHLTDGAPRMVELAREKVRAAGMTERIAVERVLLEELDAWTSTWPAGGFGGAYSNFAALNCLEDLTPVVRGLARAVAPGGRVVLVVFGPLPPGEIVTELLRGRPGSALRRLRAGAVAARLGGERFTVRYPTPWRLARSFEPWFRQVSARGVGIFVPPSAAEPWISAHPRLLRALAALDRIASAPLALLGDHVALVLRRADRDAGEQEHS